MPVATMPPVEFNGITGQKPSHDTGDRRTTATQQKVSMVGYQCPCETSGIRLNQHSAKPGHKRITIRIVPKDFAALNSPHDNVV